MVYVTKIGSSLVVPTMALGFTTLQVKGGASLKPKRIGGIKQSYNGKKYDRLVGLGEIAPCRASSTSDEATTEYPGIVDTPRPEKIDWKDVILVQGIDMFSLFFYWTLSFSNRVASCIRATSDSFKFFAAFGWESSKQGGTWYDSVKEKIPLLEVNKHTEYIFALHILSYRDGANGQLAAPLCLT